MVGRLRLMSRKELKIMLLPPSLTQWWNSLEQLGMGTARRSGRLVLEEHSQSVQVSLQKALQG